MGNIKEAAQSDGLFEVPAGYQKDGTGIDSTFGSLAYCGLGGGLVVVLGAG